MTAISVRIWDYYDGQRDKGIGGCGDSREAKRHGWCGGWAALLCDATRLWMEELASGLVAHGT